MHIKACRPSHFAAVYCMQGELACAPQQGQQGLILLVPSGRKVELTPHSLQAAGDNASTVSGPH